MSLSDQIENDLKHAMKSKQAETLSVLRMLKAATINEAIQKKKDKLEDSEIMDVIQKQAKQRKESIESFKSAGRNELAAKEENELAILQAYLPKQLSENDLREVIQKAIQESGAKSKADMGKVMKLVMPAVKGRADGKQVNEVAAKLLP